MASSVNLRTELDRKGFLSLNKFLKFLKEFHPAASVSYPTALRLIRKGQLRAYPVGSSYRVTKDEANRWVREGNWERPPALPFGKSMTDITNL